MLELKSITKIYNTFGLKQKALSNVTLSFRKSEFASILGPSGSGKTTLLNIIGGLDKYSSGDLIINGISTKKYKDSNWDSYRNHRIGFVFQSYNLISHQNVLQNVVLALTLSGINKKESVQRAKKVLKDVGLIDHIYKKPNQLSGGQMQRVAIARALVNDPDILLADEPTGALDSETSIQIMKLLKKISNDKLVIMVTHNPDLANEYSNRIITLKDGEVTSDSNPYNGENIASDEENKTSKTSMSFLTALNLSFNNLMTKKGRTILVSLAGSIGIIGISLILALSTGFQNYIDKIQEDTLSSYPLMITEENADMTSMLLSMIGENTDNEEINNNVVKERQVVSSMFESVSTNDLKNFKKHLEKNEEKLKNDVSSINYSYSIDPLIYTKYKNKKLMKLNPNSLYNSFYANNSMTNMYSQYASIFSQMMDDIDALDEQFDVLAGRWPKEYDEMVVVLSEPNGISDMLVYFLGLRDIEELYDMISDMMSGKTVKIKNEPMEFTYEDLMNIDLRLINPVDMYKYNSKYKVYEDYSEEEDYVEKLYEKALKIKIVGVVCNKSEMTSLALTPGVAYTSGLIDYMVNYSSSSEIVKKQLKNRNIDVFSNASFDEKKNNSDIDFEDLITVDNEMLESAFNIKINEKDIKNTTTNYMNEISSSITTDVTPALNDYNNSLKQVASNIMNDLVSENGFAVIHSDEVDNLVNDYLKSEGGKNILSNLEKKYIIPTDVYKNTYSQLVSGLLKGYISVYNTKDTTYTTDESNPGAMLVKPAIDPTIDEFMKQALVIGTANTMAGKMTEAVMQKEILTKVGELTGKLMGSIANAFDVNPKKIAAAFKFDLSQDELSRIMSAMINTNNGGSAKANLITLGYQNKEEPTIISVYFKNFDGKENFLDFIEEYNENMEKIGEEDRVINYTDTTGILMSSVKKVVNSVSYVLIAFVSISLIVSSIMIGIITYISVLERTKEIGILRAIGASKRNVSSIFNAETFIIGLLSGLFGIGITWIFIPIINAIIHKLTDNINISATISLVACILLILLSIILTLLGGLIPSKKASKQDPVIALRSE